MSYIQFESGKEKDKARQELREARAEMLQHAKERAEARDQRERQKELRGETDWMLPAVAKKLEKPSPAAPKKKMAKHKSKSKSSKVKKSSKKSKKRHKRRSSSSESSNSESSDSSTNSSSSESSEDDKESRRRKKKKSKSRRSRKDSSSDGEEWVERTAPVSEKPAEASTSLQRDTWMTSEALLLKTFSKERKEQVKPNEKLQQIDAYDPAKSGRELNPYWKSNGTGLPGFQRPQADDDDDGPASRKLLTSAQGSSSRGWRKPTAKAPPSPERRRRSRSPLRSASSEEEGHEMVEVDDETEEKASSGCLTDEQINELAGKAIKAELKGKTELAAELNQQLEAARKARVEFIASGKSVPRANSKPAKAKPSADSEHVLLTRTDQSGNVRPLVQGKTAAAASDPRELYGGRRGQKRSSKKVDTHVDGQRVRYFADDDRYDIKQMVSLSTDPAQIQTQPIIHESVTASLNGRSMPRPPSPTYSTPTFCPSTRIPTTIWRTYLPTRFARTSRRPTSRNVNCRVPSGSTRSWPPLWRTASAVSIPPSWTSNCWCPWARRSTSVCPGTWACRAATVS